MIRGLRSRELAPLIALVLIAISVWAFIAIAGEVVAGDTHAFDRLLLLALRNPADITQPLGPPAVQEMMRDITALGGAAILSLVTLSVAGYLLLVRRWRIMLLILVAVFGGALLSSLLKDVFARPRPDLVPYGTWEDVADLSFPSGHTMLSAVTYLTLGALLARIQPHRSLKAYILGLAMLLTLLVGLSRIYLGVHWPTDVLGGWAAGAAWAMICWLAASWLQRRGKVERDIETPLDAPELADMDNVLK